MVMSIQKDCSRLNSSAYSSVSSISVTLCQMNYEYIVFIQKRRRSLLNYANRAIFRGGNKDTVSVVFFGDNFLRDFVLKVIYSIRLMQKHQEWLSNRGYLQHLNVLTKIQTRRSPSQGRLLGHSHSLPRTHNTQQIDIEFKPQDLLTFVRSKDSMTMRDQQILWDNYHLGKRIIQTPPVISKRRLDEDYRKHKRLVQCLTASNTKKVVPTEFRVKKLQEYKENVEQLEEDRAISTATNRFFLRLSIISLAFYRQKPLLDQLVLILSRTCKDGRTRRQYSDSFQASDLFSRNFYFSLPKKLTKSEEALVVEIQNFKGLQELSVGYFSFPSQGRQNFKAQLFHCGKPIGEIVISADCGKKTAPTPRQTAS